MSLARAGQAEAARAEHDAAAAALDRAIELSSDPALLTDLLAMRFQLEAGVGRDESARTTLARLQAVGPDAPTTAMLVAESKATTGDLAGATAALAHAIRFAPAAPELRWVAGIVALEHDDLGGAERHFESLTALDGADANDWLIAGRIGIALAIVADVAAAAPRLDSATASFAAAFDGDDAVSIAMSVIDELRLRSRKFEKRLRTLAEAAARSDPENVSLSFAKAYIDSTTGFPEQALEEIDRSLVRGAGPREVDLLWLACQAHLDLDQPDSAVVRARVLLDRMPHHLPALALFVESVLRQQGVTPDRERALRYLEEARAHYEFERRRLVESAPRETRQVRAMLQESDRQLSMLEQMESALQRR
jgi:tetratricopeptide (TPR) repeat protein